MTTETEKSQEAEKALREAKSRQSGIKKRKLYDRIARYVVSLGGFGIILSIIAILFFIGIETVPLWLAPEKKLTTDASADNIVNDQNTGESAKVLGIGTEEYREQAFIISSDGKVKFFTLGDKTSLVDEYSLSLGDANEVTSLYSSVNNSKYSLSTDTGSIKPIEIDFEIKFDDEINRTIIPELSEGELIQITDKKILRFAYQESAESGSKLVAVYTEDGSLLLYNEIVEESFLGDSEITTNTVDLTEKINGEKVTDLKINSFLQNLFISTQSGKIYNFSVENLDEPELKFVVDATNDSNVAVTTLGFLLGDRSLIVGDEKGNISVWFETTQNGERVFSKVHELPPLENSIDNFSDSPRDRGFIASDIDGNIGLYHATSETQQLKIKGDGRPYNGFVFSPKADGIVAIDTIGNVTSYYIDNPHPETNFKTLFGKVWYEGYNKPAYVWQSTGGTDQFETKFSLTPLAYGTLKGAIYALIIAIPLAVLGAICVSQFMHPSIRNIVKPVIEIMAALPSVVLGFFAGLWLAPLLEKIFTAVLFIPLFITVFTLLALYLWNKIPDRITGRFKVGAELFLLAGVIMLAAVICLKLNQPLENLVFAGDFKEWFFINLGLKYDQRNAIVVGFAMAFAVIPIIFTISEDALSSVPKTLTSGSLALGANRWQTATRIVLPTASAGIFSAVMIGLGRAVGETMIVLMATGNTPVMDWSFFNGFRALSANIAVELPEAPHGGTLYRVLFLAALLLFFSTFILNTFAEIIRQRLRKKFSDG